MEPVKTPTDSPVEPTPKKKDVGTVTVRANVNVYGLTQFEIKTIPLDDEVVALIARGLLEEVDG